MKSLPICIIEGTDNIDSGIGGCIPQLLKLQDFWCMSSTLKELYCITGAPLDVLKVEL
jgi:hypothetical protein